MLENNALFGVPLIFVGFGCSVLGLIFYFWWPKAKAQPYKRISWPGYILHYFHPLAWELLAMAAFVQVRNPMLAAVFAGLGAIVYLIFIIMLAKA